jgi:hypothetical protein
MQYRPKRQSDIILIGKGPLVDAVGSILTNARGKVIKLPEIEKAHFISKGVLVYDSERIAGKRFLLVMPKLKKIPDIKGIELTEFSELGKLEEKPVKDDVTIIGCAELAVSTAMELAAEGRSVTMIYPTESLLPAYDISVQDVISRYLRKMKVKLLPQHSVLASVTKSGTTYLLAKNGKVSKKLSCTTLYIEPSETTIYDIGLDNYSEFSGDISEPVTSEKELLIINSGQLIMSLDDARTYARVLEGKRTKKPTIVAEKRARALEVEYFSFGVLEQDFIDTHIGYRKSIAKITLPNSDVTGYIIVIASLKQKIVGISGVVSHDYAGIELLRFATKNNIKVKDLARLIDIDDPLIGAYQEMYRELV